MDFLSYEILQKVSNYLRDENKNHFSQVNKYLRSVFLNKGYHQVYIDNKEDLKFSIKTERIVVRDETITDKELKYLVGRNLCAINLRNCGQITYQGILYAAVNVCKRNGIIYRPFSISKYYSYHD